MNRHAKAMILSLFWVFPAMPALAHEEFRIVGTVIRQELDGIQIKTAGGDIITVRYYAVTRFWRGEQKVAMTDVKMGGNVDVRALGDTVEDLLAMDVNILLPR
jgi:hypothetical protein